MKTNYEKNKENALTLANQCVARVTECLGGVWHVCVNQYEGMTSLTQYGSLPNPKQSMNTLPNEAEAVAFAKTFPLTQAVTVTPMTGLPWYEECAKNGWTLE